LLQRSKESPSDFPFELPAESPLKYRGNQWKSMTLLLTQVKSIHFYSISSRKFISTIGRVYVISRRVVALCKVPAIYLAGP
jgi:hypothetical protein